ncbi:metal-dependent transcriptional regulator [Thomasclavelia cocleata]|uniref:Mn-dependent transcriptional regulator, DtxR family n=1 Tax=Thomasclavelia cocleata TaxID=69824 RepID=A0A1I0EAE7_9FIRM|nr:metal-dependent transcriptional regulator [Thomasclavelia cocleata]MCR1960848.1 metal-dependent transcriptional regulator [Thomasclavelia cocleata]SET42106.1 Mn-dependent transcriptional regulator, DtxR family [Thomasclavelia cocleata]
MTIAMQNYLELIYELSLDGKKARVSDIAKQLGVSKPSVNNAVVVLAKNGYVDYEKYADIKLTDKGRKTAEFICSKHQTIKQLFIDVLNIDEKIADTDACLIEHVISDESIKAMQVFMENYQKNKLD